MLFSCTCQVNFKENCTSQQCENINDETVVPRPAKLGRVKTSRFMRRHPSTYDDATNIIHVYQYYVHQESRQFVIIFICYYQIAVVMYSSTAISSLYQTVHPLIPFISTIHKIVVLYNYTVPHIKMVHKMCKHLQNELIPYFKFDRPLLALCLHFLRKPMGIAVNKINRGESVCTKKNNSSKRLVIIVIINQNKVHVCLTIIIMLSLCSRYSQLEDGRR